jgi:AhpD family alkylhydroperoxidase
MSDLDPRQRELVAIGAAMGSNCIPCIEHHISEGRKAGLTDAQIYEAVRLANKVRQAPARNVLDVAMQMLTEPPSGVDAAGCRLVETVPPAVRGRPCCG